MVNEGLIIKTFFKFELITDRLYSSFLSSQVYVWTVVIGLSYIAGFALIPRERRQAKERLSEKEGSYSSEEALRSGSGSA